mmetsp:Transcript_65542/g.203019  ORF Transcript_65542/g.203019 Transcript_65542/m.203019 type:complete len:283 (+) Transcript_65542:996-1844(+)
MPRRLTTRDGRVRPRHGLAINLRLQEQVLARGQPQLHAPVRQREAEDARVAVDDDLLRQPKLPPLMGPQELAARQHLQALAHGGLLIARGPELLRPPLARGLGGGLGPDLPERAHVEVLQPAPGALGVCVGEVVRGVLAGHHHDRGHPAGVLLEERRAVVDTVLDHNPCTAWAAVLPDLLHGDAVPQPVARGRCNGRLVGRNPASLLRSLPRVLLGPVLDVAGSPHTLEHDVLDPSILLRPSDLDLGREGGAQQLAQRAHECLLKQGEMHLHDPHVARMANA